MLVDGLNKSNDKSLHNNSEIIDEQPVNIELSDKTSKKCIVHNSEAITKQNSYNNSDFQFFDSSAEKHRRSVINNNINESTK